MLRHCEGLLLIGIVEISKSARMAPQELLEIDIGSDLTFMQNEIKILKTDFTVQLTRP